MNYKKNCERRKEKRDEKKDWKKRSDVKRIKIEEKMRESGVEVIIMRLLGD